jgi:hypothetical protein
VIPADRIVSIEIDQATTFTKIMVVAVPVLLVAAVIVAAFSAPFNFSST